MKTYYKVLYRNSSDNLLSMGEVFDRIKELVIEYNPPGKETIAPKGTKLFVFDTYEHAEYFQASHAPIIKARGSTEIWEVEAKTVTLITRVWAVHDGYPYKTTLARTFHNYQQALRTFWWKLSRGVKPVFATTHPPMGTLACDSLILKRKVA